MIYNILDKKTVLLYTMQMNCLITKTVPTEHRDFKPVEKKPLYNTSDDTSKVQVFSAKQETTLL